MYQQEQGNLATGGSSATQHTRAVSEAAYQKRYESLLSDENCYKVVIVSLPAFSLHHLNNIVAVIVARNSNDIVIVIIIVIVAHPE